MKNLLTKTLFISLLLSVVIPSGVQADIFTQEFAKVASKTLQGLGVGATGGLGINVIAPGIAKKIAGKLEAKVEEKDKETVAAINMIAKFAVILGGGVVGTAIETARAELTLGTGAGVATGAGVGAGLGTIAVVDRMFAGIVAVSRKLLPTLEGREVGRAKRMAIVALTLTGITGLVVGGTGIGAVGGARVGAAIVRKLENIST